MKTVTALRYDAFTDTPGMGNPAGVFRDGASLSEEEMQRAAKAVGYNECVFICPSEQADLRLRYFTPGSETSLCGHATMAAVSALMAGEKGDCTLRAETLAGVLELSWRGATGEVLMQQAPAEFQPFTGDREALAASVGLTLADLDESMPAVYGSTGSWTLMLPVKDRACFERMKPRNELFPAILTEKPRASVHPFTRDCLHPGYAFHARHFSSPFSGTVEDPVTGTAAGVTGAYFLKYLSGAPECDLLIEQGLEMGRDGTVRVLARRSENGIEVSILGRAVSGGPLKVEGI